MKLEQSNPNSPTILDVEYYYIFKLDQFKSWNDKLKLLNKLINDDSLLFMPLESKVISELIILIINRMRRER